VGFTAASEQRDAEETRELLSRYFETCRRLIGLYGGTVEKFIGDAVMAVWGAPVATEDDAERAVRAALDVVAAVHELREEVGAPELRARAAVLSGEAAVTVGAESEGMVAGDLVNTASRVQGLAPPGGVLVGEGTRRATEQAIVYESIGGHELKGKAGLVPLWRALRVVSGARGTLKSEGLEAPFVGRDRELRLLKELFHASAEERKAHLISVTGIGGIGKSRLAWEFFKYIDGLQQTTLWHRGRCLAYGEGVTYWALADMVRMRCRIAEDEDSGAALGKLHATLTEYMLDEEERRFAEPRLAQLLGLEEREASSREELFGAWRLFFERLGDAAPLALVFEDMQWADASLLDFIEYLLEWSRDRPLYVITLARPELLEKRPTWGAGKRTFTALYLEPLSEQAMQELLDGLVPGLPDALRRQILARAEGVPLYAVETVRMLLDRGLLMQEGSVYRPVGHVETLEVPETLHALIAARLDGLSSDERRLLQDAAVLGKTFTRQALAAVSVVVDTDLATLLAGLVRKEVLSIQADPRSPDHGQYGFLQDLVRRVAYETLSKRERRARHIAAAAYLESAFVGEQDEVIEVIASHYLDAYRVLPEEGDAAELRANARRMLTRAGERAASLAAPGEARRYFEQACELTDESLERAALLGRAGQMAGQLGLPDEATPPLEESIEIYEREGDAHGAARMSYVLGRIQGFTERRDEAIARLEDAFEIISGDEPDEDVALIAALLGRGYWFKGDLERAAEWTEKALDIAEAYAFPEPLAFALRGKGAVAFSRGHVNESGALLRRSLELALEHDLLEEAATAYFILSDSEFRRDRYGEALEYLRESLALARRRGSRIAEWANLSELTYPLFMLGRWDEALALIPEPSQEHTRSGAVVLSLLSSLMEIHLHRGRPEEARRILSLFSHLERSSDVQDQSCYLAARASIARAEGRFQDALQDGIAAIRAAEPLGYGQQAAKQGFVAAMESALTLGDPATAHDLLARMADAPPGRRAPFLDAQAHRFRGRLDGDDAQYGMAEQLFRELELPFWLAVTQAEHGEWLTRQGRTEEAQPLLADARETFERLGAKPYLDRLETAEAGPLAEVTA
jgi:class 3 adenylate cyclase/tetratricopeptide (TPR) repeat protein